MPGDRLRVPDRVARHERATGHDAVGEQCVVAPREGVAAVAPQREEGEAVLAPLEHDPAGPAMVVLALRLRFPPGPQPQVHEPDRRHHRERQHRHVQDSDLVHAMPRRHQQHRHHQPRQQSTPRRATAATRRDRRARRTSAATGSATPAAQRSRSTPRGRGPWRCAARRWRRPPRRRAARLGVCGGPASSTRAAWPPRPPASGRARPPLHRATTRSARRGRARPAPA